MADALPAAEVIHSMPGRARLRIASRRGDAAFFAGIAAGLEAHPGVSKVEVSPLTGSIVIRHRPSLAELSSTAERAGLFKVCAAARTEEPLSREWPRLPIDPKLVAAAGLGAIALWQLARGKALPPALTLAWYAMQLAGAHPGDFDSAE